MSMKVTNFVLVEGIKNIIKNFINILLKKLSF